MRKPVAEDLAVGRDSTPRKVLANVDVGRAVQLVQEFCRVPSVLGEEGELAGLIASVLRDSGFEDVWLQPVLPNRPNAVGELRFGPGRRVLFTGHMDTKPVSRGWTVCKPFSGEVLDGQVYGHGIMDMKAALACQIVAAEALAVCGLPMRGTLAMAAVSDHMGDQRGSIAYFKQYSADLCVLGELSDNEIYLGHRGRYYFDITFIGRSAHTLYKHQAVNANVLAARAVLELHKSRLIPELDPWMRRLFGDETYVVPGRIYGGLPPGGPSMIPDECVVRVDCRPQPGVSADFVREEIERCLERAKDGDSDFRAEVKLVDVKPSYLADPDEEVVRLMVDAVRTVKGTEPELKAAGWLGDTASFGDQVPTVIFGPGGEPAYSANEHVSVEDVHTATRVYALFGALALSQPRQASDQ